MAKHFSFGERFRYRLDNLISRSPFSQVLALAVISAFIVFFAALLITVVTAEHLGLEDQNDNLLFRFWWAFTRLMDPGTFIGDTESFFVAVTGVLVTLGGILVFSLLIGILSSKIGEKLDELKQGRSPVIEQNHTLILGSGEKLPAIVKELIKANENQNRGVVAILSPVPKQEMEASLQDRINDFKTTFVVCRTGIPTDIDELKKANLTDAKSLIVLGSNSKNSDINTIKILLAAANLVSDRTTPLQTICEISEKRFGSIAEMAYSPLQWIPAREIVVRLMVQISRQNGLSAVYSEILSFSGNEIYLIDTSSVVGLSFRQIIHRVSGGIALGVKNLDGGIELNPDAERKFTEGEQLIVLTADDDTCAISEDSIYVSPEVRLTEQQEIKIPEKTLILGYNRDVGFMLRQLNSYVAPGSSILLSCHLEANTVIPHLPSQNELTNMTLAYKQIDRTNMSDMISLDPLSFDNIVVLSRKSEGLSSEAADAECIVSLLILRQIKDSTGRKSSTSIVSEIRDPRNKKLASVAKADDFIVSNEVISMILAQISEEPSLGTIYAELFDPDGCEIYLKNSALYTIHNEETTFRSIMEAAARKHEIAIGYRLTENQYDLEKNFGTTLNPDKDSSIVLSINDKVIVIADD